MDIKSISTNVQNQQTFGTLKMTPKARDLVINYLKTDANPNEIRILGEISTAQRNNPIDINLDTIDICLPEVILNPFEHHIPPLFPNKTKYKILKADVQGTEILQNFLSPVELIRAAIKLANKIRNTEIQKMIKEVKISKEEYISKELDKISNNIKIIDTKA